jgi:CheY-like chemotaxis protein
MFTVKDSGIGIPPDKHESVFELYTQADTHTTRKYGGTGLGLAICKKLVEMMAGTIWVESKEGEGSSFIFTMATQISKTPEAVQSEAAKPSTPLKSVDLQGLSILLAEDNLVNQKIALRMLEKKAWTVDTALNGKEVLEKLKQKPYDLILMDDVMPEMSGVEATKIIREEEKIAGTHIPIIAMTANAMTGDREKYLECGMDGYISKPIDREVLYSEIVNLIKQRI